MYKFWLVSKLLPRHSLIRLLDDLYLITAEVNGEEILKITIP